MSADYIEQRVATVSRRARSRPGAGLLESIWSTGLSWAVLDIVTAFIAGLIALRIRIDAEDLVAVQGSFFDQLPIVFPWRSLVYLLVFGAYVVGFSRVYGLYRTTVSRNGLNEQRLTIQAVLTAGLLLCGTLYLTRGLVVSRIVVALMIILTATGMMLRRAIWRKVQERRYLQGRETRNVLIVGTGRVGVALRNHLQALPHMGFRFLGFVSLDADTGEGLETLGRIDDCVALARSLFVDEIYFSSPAAKEVVLPIVEEARANGIEVRVVPDLYDGLAWNAPVEFVGQFPTIRLHRKNFPRGAFLLKRVLDVLICLAGLFLLAPVLLIIAVLIRLDSPGPIFYRSRRVGRKGRTFTCYKFRTMVAKADQMRAELDHRNERDGVLFKISNDPRVTRVGRWLRKYSLDELPQCLNVLSGDMSLVGPRPPLANEVEKYDLSHLKRLDVLPGITGLWQVEARQDPSFDSYISLDTAYVENWNVMLDLRIMARTVGVVAAGTGT